MLRYSLRQLEYLVACIESGSFAAAAAKLNVSQPSISTAIAKLEAALGVQLLLRHHAQGVTPTASGERILQSARNLLNHAGDLQRIGDGEDEALASELTLGCFLSLAPAFLPGMMADLQSKQPGLKLTLREGTQDVLIEDLRQGRCEMALLYDLGLPGGLRLTPLATLNPQVVLPEGHPAAQEDAVSLRALADDPLILLDVPPSRDYFLGLLSSVGMKVEPAHVTPSFEVVRGLVGNGLGYTLLVTRPFGDITYDGRGLAVRPIRENVQSSNVVLAAVNDLRPTRAMRAFESFAVDFFAAEGKE